MPRTVEQEMPKEQRARELLMGLKSIRKEKVIVNISHLAQVVGMDTADELAESLTGSTEVPFFRVRRRSTIRTSVRRGGMCQVDRQAAVEAIESTMESDARRSIDKAVASQHNIFWQPPKVTTPEGDGPDVSDGVEPDEPIAVSNTREVSRPRGPESTADAVRRKAEELKKAAESSDSTS